jgi:hypothetical protein
MHGRLASIPGFYRAIEIGFIGAGGIGTLHLEACRELKDSGNFTFLGEASKSCFGDGCQRKLFAHSQLRPTTQLR